MDQSLVTSFPITKRLAAVVVLALLLFLVPARAAETLPPFKLDGRAYTNAVVIEANPVDVLIRQGELGFKRLKRLEMPAELKDRFPYDAKEVEEYEKQKAAKAKAQREQQRAETFAALKRQEVSIQASLRDVEKKLAALQRELDVLGKMARGKPNSAARQELDRLRLVKRDHIRHVDQLRDQLEQVRASQNQFR